MSLSRLHIFAAVVAIVLLTLIGGSLVFWQSSKPPPSEVREGIVVASKFIPTHTYEVEVPQYAGQSCVEEDEDGTEEDICSPRYIDVLQQRVAPDKWTLTVRGCPRQAKQPPQICQATQDKDRTVTVSQSDYNLYKVGDKWSEVSTS